MTTTTNLGLTQLEIGQTEKEVTINTNMAVLDAKVPRALPDAASAPATTGLAPGSTYYNTAESKKYWLRPNLTWVEDSAAIAGVDLTLSNSLTLASNANIYTDTGNIGWQDLTADIHTRGVGTNDPTWAVFRNGIRAYSFISNQLNEAWVTFHIDHSYAPGTPIYLHMHWADASAAPSGNVVWGFEYTIAKGHQQEAFPATTTVTVTQASTVRYQHQIAEISTSISSASIEPDSLILVRVYRDGLNVADTCPNNVFGFFADAHYQVSRFATKNRAPNFYA
jgi:hypothetical protein